MFKMEALDLVRLGADLVGLAPEHQRTLSLTLLYTYNSSTPIGPFDVQTGCIWSAEWALQDAWFLAYNVRCALSACMFKIEPLDSEAWRRPSRADPRIWPTNITIDPTLRMWFLNAYWSVLTCKLDAYKALNVLFKIHDF